MRIRRIGMLAVAGVTLPLASSFSFQPESKLWIEGTSTVRGFKCEAKQLDGAVATNPAVTGTTVADLQALVTGGELVVAVPQLECGNGTMNSHMRKALLADRFETIRFELKDHEVALTADGEGQVELTGTLTMAGTQRPIKLEANTVSAQAGTVRVQGSTTLDMTEWGMKPPKLMLGTLKVNPRVVVRYDVLMKR